MGSHRVHVVVPDDFLTRIDAEVGPRGRSAFIVDLAQAEFRRRKLQEFLRSKEPVMRDEDHPELAAMGTQAWVKMMRSGDEERLRRLHADVEPVE